MKARLRRAATKLLAVPLLALLIVPASIGAAPVCDPWQEIPCAPSLRASTSGQMISLRWIDRSETEERFVIERQEGASFVYVDETFMNEAWYDIGPLPFGTYTYRVRAENEFGSSPSNPVTVTLASNGVLTYALAPDDAESEAGIVVGGTMSVLAKYLFSATGTEDLKLTKVRLQLPNGSATAVQSLSLFDGPNLIAGPVPVQAATGTAADFSGFSFIVPRNASKTLTVKGTLAQVGPLGARSGSDLNVTLCDGSGSGLCAGDAGTYLAVGTAAGSTFTDSVGNGGDVPGREKRLRKAKPTVSLMALPTSILNNGTQVVSRFTVTADPAGQVSLKKMTFQLGLRNLGGSALSLSPVAGAGSGIREVGQVSDIAGTLFMSTSASSTVTVCSATGTESCLAKVVFAAEQVIAAGTSKTYELRLTVAGADASNESVGAILLGDTAQVTGELDGSGSSPVLRIDDLDGAPAPGEYNFVWSDHSAIPHNDAFDTNGDYLDDPAASNDWTNARFVKLLPSDPQTLVRP